MESTLVWTKDDEDLFGVNWNRKELPLTVECGHCHKEYERVFALKMKGQRCPHCGTRNNDIQC